jgi:3-phenylpropionate/cinnamic acid dioxygenase small subunit
MPAPADVREGVLGFLYHEAELLDAGRFEEWLDLMTDDVQYRAPARLTRERATPGDRSQEMQLFWDDRETLTLRVRRLRTDFAWAEDPPSRTRHFITNVRIAPGDRDHELAVRSNVLVYRNRGDGGDYELISGERHDTLRRVGGAWRLARREFLIDQASLANKNLAIFV